MTGLLILETLLLIVIVIGMICLATLYYSLYKGFIALKNVAETALPEQNEVIKTITTEMDSFLNIMQSIEDEALECYGLSERLLKDANENKEFAMQTIKSARLIQNRLDEASKAIENSTANFKFEEQEDDPENPRS